MNSFELAGRHFDYQVSEYNRTRLNERAVEVPVGLALLGQATDGECSVLEVGAVLPHYRAGWPADGHTVIDLHEVYPGVINADVLTWQPPRLIAPAASILAKRSGGYFDLIISISTLDHLHDYEQLIDALRQMRRWLAPGGLLFITLPYGQPAHVGGGPWIDRFVLGENDADAVWRLDKTDPTHHLWTQILEDAPHLSYNGRAPCANTVYLLLWGDVERWWQS